MTYSPDLEQRGSVRTVGYLSRDHDYPKGEISEAVFDRLGILAQLRLVDWMGKHRCDLGLCWFSQGEGALYWRGMKVPRSCSSDVLVPDRTVVYIAPALILHYIRAHQYLPPECFLEAVVSCPEPGSDQYLANLKKLAPEFGHFLG